MTTKIRNIAIIAHVDHGKTTLVDSLLKQSQGFKLKSDAVSELIMDSNELERERGITIFSKNASVIYKGVKINIVDTPGHADFGGEVERIMRMVDGVLLLVDAKEGPMPQTKFVLKKAIAAGHRAIVVINKIDKHDARVDWVLNQTFDLFVALGASDQQANFPVIYASAISGKAGLDPDLSKMTNVVPLFEKILETIPEPKINKEAPLQMLTVNLAYDNYKGKIAIGRLYSGTVKKGMEIAHINRNGKITKTRLTSVMTFDGLGRVETEEAEAGDIAAIAGIPDISIGETIADANNPIALPTIEIEEPTVKMTFGVNTSPFAGSEGQYTTSRNIKERLEHELELDIALRVAPADSGEKWIVSGRGELHLSILIEKMRREGFELQVSRPQVIYKDGSSPDISFDKTKGYRDAGIEPSKKLEPIEQLSIECPEEFSGSVIAKMGIRRGEMKDMRVDGLPAGRQGKTAHLEFTIPTRGLIGYRNEFMTDTKGLGIMNSLFLGYEPYKGDFETSPHGSLVAFEAGESNTYGLLAAQERGDLFIGPNVQVYEGMVVGQNAKPEDLSVNVCKEKKLSNMRSKGDGVAEALDVPRSMGLENALEYIGDDELVEVTPKNIRIRKAVLGALERKRNDR